MHSADNRKIGRFKSSPPYQKIASSILPGRTTRKETCVKQEYLTVNWEVDDGYAGGRRPQTTRIPVEDFEKGMTRDEIQDIIQGYVQEDFEQNVGPAFSDLDKSIDDALRLTKGRE